MVKRYYEKQFVSTKTVEIFECPDCGFEFNAMHEVDEQVAGWECPLCEVEELQKTIKHGKIIKFMKDFGIDILNRFDELIIDWKTNTFAYIGDCQDIDDVKTRVVYSLCRPIGKGLEIKDAVRLLNKFNKYFETELTRADMLLMYQELCYNSKLGEFKEFIKRGFPIDELKST